MKNYILVLFSLCIAMMANAQNQNLGTQNFTIVRKPFKDIRKKTIFSLSPFHFFDNSFAVSSEFFLSDSYKKSIRLSIISMYADNEEKTDKGIGLDISGRYYPMSFQCDSMVWARNQASGIYLAYGAHLGLNNFSSRELNNYSYDPSGNFIPTYRTTKRESIWISPFICFGYQFTVYESIFIDVFVGGAMKMNEVKTTRSVGNTIQNAPEPANPGIFDRHYKGILPKGGFTIGIGF